MNEEKKEVTVYSEHLFLWPFSISGKSGSRSASEHYLKALDGQGCWKPLEASETMPVSELYEVREYLSNEARGIFPTLSPKPEGASGVCSILRRPVPPNSSFEIQFGETTWSLRPAGLELHVYPYGVGILILHVVNERYGDLSEIARFADYGRRVRHPFVPGEGETGLAADRLALNLGHQKFEFDLLNQARQAVGISVPADKSSKSFQTLFDVVDPDIQLTPVADDRMFEMELLYHQGLSEELKNKAWRENEELTKALYALVFCDPKVTFPSCQDTEMRRRLLLQTIDPRWADEGTLYAASEYSFLCITGEGDHSRVVLGPNFLHQYLYMTSLVLAQRTGLMNFAERAGKQTFGWAKQNWFSKLRSDRNLKHLNKEYAAFQALLMISRYSDQDQGIELYELLQKQLRVEQYRDKIQRQLSDAFASATLDAQNRQNWIIGVVGIVLVLLQIFLAA